MVVAWERAPNEMLSWQGHIATAEAHYCQMCFCLSRGCDFTLDDFLHFSLSLLAYSFVWNSHCDLGPSMYFLLAAASQPKDPFIA